MVRCTTVMKGWRKVLLLLHMAGSSSDQYERIIPFLSKDFHAIAPDLMRYGDSDKPPRKYDIIDHAQSILDYMDELGIEKANIVGTHVWGTICTKMAVNWPDCIDRLILSCLPYF